MSNADIAIICSRIVAYIGSHPKDVTPLYNVYMKHRKDYPYTEYVKHALSMMSSYKVHSIIDPFEIKQIDEHTWSENGIQITIG